MRGTYLWQSVECYANEDQLGVGSMQESVVTRT